MLRLWAHINTARLRHDGTPSLSRSGGEGWGEEVLFARACARDIRTKLALSPSLSHSFVMGEGETSRAVGLAAGQ
jgi:hypothetical protein